MVSPLINPRNFVKQAFRSTQNFLFFFNLCFLFVLGSVKKQKSSWVRAVTSEINPKLLFCGNKEIYAWHGTELWSQSSDILKGQNNTFWLSNTLWLLKINGYKQVVRRFLCWISVSSLVPVGCMSDISQPGTWKYKLFPGQWPLTMTSFITNHDYCYTYSF